MDACGGAGGGAAEPGAVLPDRILGLAAASRCVSGFIGYGVSVPGAAGLAVASLDIRRQRGGGVDHGCCIAAAMAGRDVIFGRPVQWYVSAMVISNGVAVWICQFWSHTT